MPYNQDWEREMRAEVERLRAQQRDQGYNQEQDEQRERDWYNELGDPRRPAQPEILAEVDPFERVYFTERQTKRLEFARFLVQSGAFNEGV